jgi:hypothetical protein
MYSPSSTHRYLPQRSRMRVCCVRVSCACDVSRAVSCAAVSGSGW